MRDAAVKLGMDQGMVRYEISDKVDVRKDGPERDGPRRQPARSLREERFGEKRACDSVGDGIHWEIVGNPRRGRESKKASCRAPAFSGSDR